MRRLEFVVYLSDKTIYWAQLHKQEHEPVEVIAAGYERDGWAREKRREREEAAK